MADPSGPQNEPAGAPKLTGPLRIHLEFEEHRCFLSEWASDLGEGGVFVSTEYLYPPGTPVVFQCLLGRKGPLLEGTGEVAWIKSPSEEDEDTGLGLRIVTLTTPNQELLGRALAAVLEQGEESFDLEAFARQEAGGAPDPDAPTEELPDTESQTSFRENEASVDLDDTAPLHPVSKSSNEEVEGDEGDEDDEEPTEVIVTSSTESQAPVTDIELRQGPESGEWRRPPSENGPKRSTLGMQILVAVVALMIAGGLYLLRERLFLADTQSEPTSSGKSLASAAENQTPAEDLFLSLPAPESDMAVAPEDPDRFSGGFRQVAGIRVRERAQETHVIIETDGLVPSHRFAHFRLDGPSPREVVQLFELAAPQRPAQLNVNGRLIRQVRTGFHDYDDGNELRVVLDLQTAAARVDHIEVDGQDLLVLVVQSGT
jgi:uncharacterized protein (TIGR02266 family)